MLSEINPHEKDDIEFDEKEHKYRVGNHQFSISVTGFVHEHFPEFKENEVIRGILNSKKMNDKSYEYYGMNAIQIKEKWVENARLGTELHALIEDYYNGKKRTLEEVNTKEYGYFLKFANDFDYIVPFRTEFRLRSFKLDIAGSIDLIIKNPDGTFSILDWKRAKNIDMNTEPNKYTKYGILPGISHIINTNYSHYKFQLNIYRYILESEYGFNISGMYLVIFHPNNDSYNIIDVPKMDKEMSYIMKIRMKKIKNANNIL